MTGRQIIVDDLDQPERPGDQERLAKWFEPGPVRDLVGSDMAVRQTWAIKDSLPSMRDHCPYCPARPRNLRAHCRAKHPNKPEARR